VYAILKDAQLMVAIPHGVIMAPVQDHVELDCKRGVEPALIRHQLREGRTAGDWDQVCPPGYATLKAARLTVAIPTGHRMALVQDLVAEECNFERAFVTIQDQLIMGRTAAGLVDIFLAEHVTLTSAK